MNFWAAFLTFLAVLVAWQVWQAQGLVRAHVQAKDAWDRTNDLLRQRRDFAHQVVIYSESMGWWNHEAMNRLIKASDAVKTARSQEERLAAERALGSALRHTMGVLDQIASREEAEDLALMATYWSSTERKIDFARRYYNKAAEAANKRMGTQLARTMVRCRAVRQHQVFSPEDARGNPLV
ncbi:MAG: LemA family protein [bacterium]